MEKPQSYDQLYPGRFLKAPLFKGKHVTLTIADVFNEALVAEAEDKDGDAEPPKTILSFKETKMQLVIPKTNGFCIMQMFGKRLADWVGKKVVFFPTTTKFGRDTVDCIRVFGSPDIAGDLPLVIPQGRKKPLKMTMHAVKAGAKSAPITTAKPDVDPALLVAWTALGWTVQEGEQDRAQYKGTDYAGHLSTLIDEMNAREGSGL
jgi:hypothetical protein